MRRAIHLWVAAGVLLFSAAARASAQTKVIDPYSLPMVQAACGGESESAPQGSVGSHGAEPALKPGLARVYVITETRGLFGKLGEPVRLGIDGHWFGVNHETVYGYSYVDVMPGVHHLCVASKVRGAVPHTNNAVLLSRVEAVAGQSYSFYNQYIRIMGMFTLRPMSVDEGAMFRQALPSSGLPELWKTAEAQQFCGTDAGKMPSGSVPEPPPPGPPEAGKALVYYFSGVPQFGNHGFLSGAKPVLVGLDGHWVGMTQTRSYAAVQIDPGKHRLCVAYQVPPFWDRSLNVGQLNVVAGKTYFVNVYTMQPEEDTLAVAWLRKIAAMPKSDSVNLYALSRWSWKNFPASPDELGRCGIPSSSSKAATPTPVTSPSKLPQLFFLLKGNERKLSRRNAIKAGVDGRWVAELRRNSWVPVSVAPGQHSVCIYTGWSNKPTRLVVSADTQLFLDRVDAEVSADTYFQSVVHVFSDFDLLAISRIDPDEGAMLVALYPRADVVQP